MPPKPIACSAGDCIEPAEFLVSWPGQRPARMCQTCADRASGVARAMGFVVPVEPLPVAVVVAPQEPQEG
ncbi:MAG: hypothetical protein RMA76_38225 [Deltaproteobacteria bacterium]|jgi:hypothetical protein